MVKFQEEWSYRPIFLVRENWSVRPSESKKSAAKGVRLLSVGLLNISEVRPRCVNFPLAHSTANDRVQRTAVGSADDFGNISIGTTHLPDELQEYLRPPVENVADPLKWWVNNKLLYPNLHRMALDHLSVPRKYLTGPYYHIDILP